MSKEKLILDRNTRHSPMKKEWLINDFFESEEVITNFMTHFIPFKRRKIIVSRINTKIKIDFSP